MDFWQRKNSKTLTKSNEPSHNINWNGHSVSVQRKPIRSLRLTITPKGAIKVSIPVPVSDAEVLSFLNRKSEWILNHLSRIEALQASMPLDYSSIAFLGVSYPVERQISNIAPRIVLGPDNIIHLFLKPGTPPEKLDAIVDAFYRKELKKLVEPLVQEWEPILGVKAKELCFKRMKTRWGTCNVVDHRIWINTELAKYAYPCIEYIVVHELCHLLERGHGPAFKALMDKHLPHWKSLRHELNGKGVQY